MTITKDDPAGIRRTLDSTAGWCALPWVEQIVVYGGEPPRPQGAGSVQFHAQRAPGIAHAFNEGLRLARGQWVWCLNGGDATHEGLEPVWMRRLLEATGADLVVGTIHADGDPAPRQLPPLRRQWPLLDSWLPHPATFVRRSVLLGASGFDAEFKICMDFDLWQRLLGADARVDVLSVPFARYDQNGVSSRPDTRRALLRENRLVLLRHQRAVWQAALDGGVGLAARVLHAWRSG